MITLLIVAGVVLVIGAVVFVVMGRRETALVAASPRDDFEEGVVSEPVPISATAVRAALDGVRADRIDRIDEPRMSAAATSPTADVTAPAAAVSADAASVTVAASGQPHVRWTKQFEPRSGALDDQARLRLINDLGMLRAPWCVPLLVQACEEETEPAHRVAAQLALARCREENAV